MTGRKYKWIVISCGLVSAIFLQLAYARYSHLATARGLDLGYAWQLWGLAPGAFCVLVWAFQKRKWLRLAGMVASIGVLGYSTWSLALAFAPYASGGDMAGLVTLAGAFAFVLTIVWSLVALLIGGVSGLVASGGRGATPRPNALLERTRDR